MKLKIYPPLSIYEIGQRSNQEDSISHWDNRLFVLCDGMGGHEKGEVASQTICQALRNWFNEHVAPDTSFTNDQLKEAIEFAYTELDKYADGSLKQMGTTLTLLYIGSNGITAAHIGDSRIYHIRPEEGILYQSRDHSLVFDLFQAGEINYKEMATHPQKNIITRAMTPGLDKRTRADIVHITDVQSGDYFYMCSDGMLEQMDNEELLSLFSANTSDEKKRQQLIAATADNKDNHSAWIIHVKDVSKEEGDGALVDEEKTARCNAIYIINKAMQQEALEERNEEAEDEDVVVVSPPKNKKGSLIKVLILVLATIALLAVLWFYLLKGTNDKDNKQVPPTMTETAYIFEN